MRKIIELDSTAFDSPEFSLIDRLRAREESAFEELVRVYGPRMLSVAKRFLRCEADAEDALQQAFLSAFQSIERFAERSSLATWLHRIVVSRCLMQLRSRKRKPVCSLDELMPKFDCSGRHERAIRNWSDTALDSMRLEERRQQLLQCLDELPDHYRVVVQLRDIEEFDTATTAAILKTSENVVKTRLHRARQALREVFTNVFLPAHRD